MARTRRAAVESAYERRIRRYLEAHPGATRQEARGHKPPKGRSEYAERIRRYKRRHPGASTQEAAGRRPEVARERRIQEAAITEFLDYLEPNDIIMLADHISTILRLPDGRWAPHEKNVIPADETRDFRTFPLPAMTDERLQRLIDQELAAGAKMTPIASLDQSKLDKDRAKTEKRRR